jgi:hypothetical protein
MLYCFHKNCLGFAASERVTSLCALYNVTSRNIASHSVTEMLIVPITSCFLSNVAVNILYAEERLYRILNTISKINKLLETRMGTEGDLGHISINIYESHHSLKEVCLSGFYSCSRLILKFECIKLGVKVDEIT